MTAIEIILVLGLTVFTLLGMFGLAYLVVIMPMKEAIEKLQEANKQNRFQEMRMAIPALGPKPKVDLPSIDDLPESVYDIGNYGTEESSPDEVDQEMSDLENAAREADQSWRDLEDLKHGKRSPIIYSGN